MNKKLIRKQLVHHLTNTSMKKVAGLEVNINILSTKVPQEC